MDLFFLLLEKFVFVLLFFDFWLECVWGDLVVVYYGGVCFFIYVRKWEDFFIGVFVCYWYVYYWGGVRVFEGIFDVGDFVCIGECFGWIDYIWRVCVSVWIRVFGFWIF